MAEIFIINIGSTSTRVGMFRNNTTVFTETVNHFSDKIAKLKDFNDWYTFNLSVVDEILDRYQNK
ncbi:MAG: hypothetical protein DRH34_12220, partial [Deltaproteobacteria bacterium]